MKLRFACFFILQLRVANRSLRGSLACRLALLVASLRSLHKIALVNPYRVIFLAYPVERRKRDITRFIRHCFGRSGHSKQCQ